MLTNRAKRIGTDVVQPVRSNPFAHVTRVTLALFLLVVLIAFVSEALVGFGATVITVTLGAHLYPLDVLLPAFVPVNLALSAYLVLRYHDAIDRAVLLRRVLPLVGLGMPVGMIVFHLREQVLLQVLFAAFVVALAALELGRAFARPSDAPRPLAFPAAAAALILGGFIHGVFGSGGPMIVYYASRTIRDKTRFRSTLSALWLVLNAILVTNYSVSGMITAETGMLSAALVPALLVGAFLGERIHGRVRERPFRLSVFLLLLLAGSVLLVRGILKM